MAPSLVSGLLLCLLLFSAQIVTDDTLTPDSMSAEDIQLIAEIYLALASLDCLDDSSCQIQPPDYVVSVAASKNIAADDDKNSPNSPTSHITLATGAAPSPTSESGPSIETIKVRQNARSNSFNPNSKSFNPKSRVDAHGGRTSRRSHNQASEDHRAIREKAAAGVSDSGFQVGHVASAAVFAAVAQAVFTLGELNRTRNYSQFAKDVAWSATRSAVAATSVEVAKGFVSSGPAAVLVGSIFTTITATQEVWETRDWDRWVRNIGDGVMRSSGAVTGFNVGATIGTVFPVVGTLFGGIAGSFLGQYGAGKAFSYFAGSNQRTEMEQQVRREFAEKQLMLVKLELSQIPILSLSPRCDSVEYFIRYLDDPANNELLYARRIDWSAVAADPNIYAPYLREYAQDLLQPVARWAREGSLSEWSFGLDLLARWAREVFPSFPVTRDLRKVLQRLRGEVSLRERFFGWAVPKVLNVLFVWAVGSCFCFAVDPSGFKSAFVDPLTLILSRCRNRRRQRN